MEDTHEARREHFNSIEYVDPLLGYGERNVAWFELYMMQDVIRTKERLHLGPVVLDVGCAQGYFTRRYASIFEKVIGIDFSESRIAAAKKYNSTADDVTYIVADLLRDEIKDLPDIHDEIDTAISSAVMQHIAPNDRRAAFQNVYNVLKPKGYFVLWDENYNVRPNSWDNFYEPISPEWIRANIADLFNLVSCEFVFRGQSGEWEYRYELKRK